LAQIAVAPRQEIEGLIVDGANEALGVRDGFLKGGGRYLLIDRGSFGISGD
jgi:hypothetical protein